MMINDASHYLFCYSSKQKKTFKQKSFGDFTITGQQFTSMLTGNSEVNH